MADGNNEQKNKKPVLFDEVIRNSLIVLVVLSTVFNLVTDPVEPIKEKELEMLEEIAKQLTETGLYERDLEWTSSIALPKNSNDLMEFRKQATNKNYYHPNLVQYKYSADAREMTVVFTAVDPAIALEVNGTETFVEGLLGREYKVDLTTGQYEMKDTLAAQAKGTTSPYGKTRIAEYKSGVKP